MTDPYTGGCRCGAIRFEIAAEPVFSNHCQCRDCRQVGGTGHSSYLTFARDAVVLSGDPHIWAVVADSGNTKRHGSCATCGSPVTLTFDAMPTILAVHAAALDQPARFKPQAVTYASRALPWDAIDPQLARFEKGAQA